jgi:hypothetical protein
MSIYDGWHCTEPGNNYGREISTLDDFELEDARAACAAAIAKIEEGVGTCRFGKYRASPAAWAAIQTDDPGWFGWLVRKRRDNLAIYDREIARRGERPPDDDIPF